MQRWWANLSLLAALAVFLVALGFRHQAWAGYVETMALAAMAGGIADWYAVTALFRHPLGIRWLPHTAIISANRDRIIEAIATLVETELLSAPYLQSVLSRMTVVPRVLQWLRQAEEGQALSSLLEPWLTALLEMVDSPVVAGWLAAWAEPAADRLSAADAVVNVLRWLIQSGNDRPLFGFLVAQADRLLATVEFTQEMEQRLRQMVERYTKTTAQKLVLGILESIGTVDYPELSKAVRDGLHEWLHSPEALEQFELLIVRVLMTVRDDPAVRRRIEEVKRALVAAIPWERLAARGLEELAEARRQGRLGRALARWLYQAADRLQSDPEAVSRLEGHLKAVIVGAVARYHPWSGRLVRENLRQMNEKEWIDKLEWYVGRDLQWIRVNGAVVGGLIGLVLFVLVRMVWR
jgi:uncharacterized membrane-anchored protein YjiN (DUF445 family)